MSASKHPAAAPIAITMGDGAGIGPEIIAKAFLTEPDTTAGCVVVGDLATMRRAAAVAAQALGQAPLPCAPVTQLADVAQLALFLGSEHASFITGALIPCDGGASLLGGRNHSRDSDFFKASAA